MIYQHSHSTAAVRTPEYRSIYSIKFWIPFESVGNFTSATGLESVYGTWRCWEFVSNENTPASLSKTPFEKVCKGIKDRRQMQNRMLHADNITWISTHMENWKVGYDEYF
jgi:hypothetical protein